MILIGGLRPDLNEQLVRFAAGGVNPEVKCIPVLDEEGTPCTGERTTTETGLCQEAHHRFHRTII